jgi:phenylpropionate dioxygenase-like ring-hydroxylating dioxygenase large terminal subunit
MTSVASANTAQTYNAYNSRRGLQPDDELTRVGRGTPMGEVFRRYWQPVANIQELGDLPLKLRILGEDLVLFRTNTGEYGLVEQRCAHRGASLEYGVISDRGLRCAYHGFHYAPDGTILETGAGAPLAGNGKICLGAYPLQQFHDVIFAYMGPPELRPPFPLMDILDDPHITVETGHLRDCVNESNWLQIHENAMDPIHTMFLHGIMTGLQRGFTPAMQAPPVMQFIENENGMHYIATRRVGDLAWVRVLDVMMPNMGYIPPSGDTPTKADVSQRPILCAWAVPIDDYNTKRIYVLFNDDRKPLTQIQRERAFAQANDRSYEEGQRHPGDYEMMMSQGKIAIHAYENVTSTDYGVIGLRQLYRECIRAVREGRDPMGIHRDGKKLRVRTQNTIVLRPPAATPEADTLMLKQVGREIADSDLLHTLPPV